VKVVRVTRDDGVVICERCVVAHSVARRMKGLLGRGELPAGEGIHLKPASSVHMFFMRFPIDVVFLDGDLRVVDVRHALQPWRVAAKRGAKSALELAAGEAERRGLRVGDRVRLDD
jgi:uncharacterized membrane protein (UPF0127 family)